MSPPSVRYVVLRLTTDLVRPRSWDNPPDVRPGRMARAAMTRQSFRPIPKVSRRRVDVPQDMALETSARYAGAYWLVCSAPGTSSRWSGMRGASNRPVGCGTGAPPLGTSVTCGEALVPRGPWPDQAGRCRPDG